MFSKGRVACKEATATKARPSWLGSIILGAVLGLGMMARSAAAAPFAYVTNNGANDHCGDGPRRKRLYPGFNTRLYH